MQVTTEPTAFNRNLSHNSQAKYNLSSNKPIGLQNDITKGQEMQDLNYLIEAENGIQKTLSQMTGLGFWQSKPTQSNNVAKLRHIAKHVDIFNPESVKQWIMKSTVIYGANKGQPKADTTKNALQEIYANFASANNIKFQVTKLNKKAPIPLIPSTENVYTIINSCKQHYYVPFAIMAETAIEGEELHNIRRNQIDTQTGILSVVGTKRHNNGTYTLKPELAEALRLYLAKNNREKPFPPARVLGEAWRRYRKTKARDTGNQELLKIQLKSLRNYAGAIYYLTMGKDPLATRDFMRHKKLSQTDDYLRGIKQFQINTQKIGKLATTPEEIMELLLQGFKEESIVAQGTPQEKHILTKMKY